MIVQGTTIVQHHDDRRRLQILEALIIKDRNPNLNSQINDDFVIPSSRNFDPRIKFVREDAGEGNRGSRSEV